MTQIIVEEGFFDRHEEVGKSLEVPYFVFHAANESEVKAACEREPGEGGLPNAISDCLFDGYSIEDRVNETTWKVIARYKRPVWEQVMSPDAKFTFDTGGGTQHVTQSLSTAGRYGKSSAKYQGAIGFDGKNVQGVDITVPVFNFTESHWFTDAQMSQGFKLTLFRLTGKTNAQAFRGFSGGEVLFLGAGGNRQGDDPSDKWELTYKFAAMPNRSNFSIGGITVVSKLGWEYLWVRYQDDVDDDNQEAIKVPVAVYVERVYEGANFSGLGIGVD